MAEYKFTAALNAATFPLVTKFQPRTVVISGLDNQLRSANSSTRETSDNDNNPKNLPQVMYVENVMSTDEGVVSVGFTQLQDQVAAITQFDEVFILRDETENTWFYSPCAGRNYVTAAFGTAWASINPLAGVPVGNEVSVAYVNGVTYICYANLKLIHWDGAAFIDDTAGLTGVAIADIKAICGSGNYLCLLCNDLSFKWSSILNPLDFVPSADTGAGSQIPVDVRGGGVCLTSVSGGVIIHCAQNAVAALSTNNSAAPWTFREIKNAGGITTRKQVSTDNNSGATYIWGTNGFQQLGLREAETQFPAITDFLSSRVNETFDSTTNLFTVTRMAANFFVKLSYIAGRYIVISYGTTSTVYSYALIYDIGLRRWGKIKRDHVDCFSGYFASRQSICLLSNTGVVNLAAFDWRTVSSAGILILGRYQINRTHQICSQEVVIETLDSEDNPTVHVCSNYNGTNVGEIHQMTAYVNSGAYRSYQKQIEGENLTYIIKGGFAISTVLMTHTLGARF